MSPSCHRQIGLVTVHACRGISDMSEPSRNGTAPGGRDPMSGRFSPGNRFSQGNSVARRTRELRQAALEAVTVDQVRAVIGKLAELAANGDVPAARVFLEHVIGKPTQVLELSGPDGEALGVDMARLVATIQTAVANFPEVKFGIAAELQKLSRNADEDTEPDRVNGDRA